MFHIPWVLTLSIAATRMYRCLDDFLSSNMYDKSLLLSSLRLLREKSHFGSHPPTHKGSRRISISSAWAPAVPIPLDGRVDVHTAHNHSVTSQAIRHSLDSNTDKELYDKPHELV
jgi:hypothetical protein